MSYPLAVLGNMPNVMKLLQIPEDHYISLMVGFGYPGKFVMLRRST